MISCTVANRLGLSIRYLATNQLPGNHQNSGGIRVALGILREDRLGWFSQQTHRVGLQKSRWLAAVGWQTLSVPVGCSNVEMLFTYLLANAKHDVGVAAHVQELVDITPKNESVQPFPLILVFLGLVIPFCSPISQPFTGKGPRSLCYAARSAWWTNPPHTHPHTHAAICTRASSAIFTATSPWFTVSSAHASLRAAHALRNSGSSAQISWCWFYLHPKLECLHLDSVQCTTFHYLPCRHHVDIMCITDVHTKSYDWYIIWSYDRYGNFLLTYVLVTLNTPEPQTCWHQRAPCRPSRKLHDFCTINKQTVRTCQNSSDCLIFFDIILLNCQKILGFVTMVNNGSALGMRAILGLPAPWQRGSLAG